MKVHLIKKQTIENFVAREPQGKSSFEIWLSIITRADWDTPQDIVKTFNSADILGKGSERVVFNVGGNKYRVICKYFFGEKQVHLFVKWIGVHANYTKLCDKGGQYTVEAY